MNKRTGWLNALRAMTLIMLVNVMLFSTVTPALAAEFIEDDYSVVGEDEVIDDDLFITGNRVEMNGVVKGDLFAAGEHVEINGVVEGNVIVAGETVTVNGDIQGSLFVGANNVTVAGTVDGSLMVGAYSLDVVQAAFVEGSLYFGGNQLNADAESEIVRNLYAGGYKVDVAGAVGRDVYAGVNVFELTGTVGRDVSLYLDQENSRVNIAEGAVAGEVTKEFVENLDYDTDFDSVEFAEFRQYSGRAFWANRARQRVGEFIGLMLVAVVVLWKGGTLFDNAVSKLKNKPSESFLWGFLSLILFPFVVVFAAVFGLIATLMMGLFTLGDLMGFMIGLTGTGLGVLVMTFTFMSYLLGRLVTGYVVGEWLFKQVMPDMVDGPYGKFWAVALGVFVFEGLRMMPVAGWFIGLIFVSFGLGAIVLYLYGKYFGAKEKPAEETTEVVEA